jgi:UTP--glucose-1-phosphate uridylyltransferase
MTSPISKAVIPTDCDRGMLPATKTIPIELLPLAGVPVIERIVASASDAGLTDLLLITNASNRAIEDHFDHDLELERRLTELDDRPGLLAVRRAAALATVHSIRQRRPLGTADALMLARSHVGDESFVLLTPNRLVDLEHHLLHHLLGAHARSGSSAVAVPLDIDPRHVTSRELEHYGRFILTPDIFDAVSHVSPDLAGHRQLGDALLALHRRNLLEIITFDTDVCDVGDRLDRLRVELELLLADPHLGGEVERVLADSLGRRPSVVAA